MIVIRMVMVVMAMVLVTTDEDEIDGCIFRNISSSSSVAQR